MKKEEIKTMLKSILKVKSELDNNETIGMVAVSDILEYITNIETTDSKLNDVLNKIYSVLEDSDSCTLWEDLEYLENDFKSLKKIYKTL